MEKICVFCKYYYFNPGSPTYSEWTVGSDAEEGCIKEYWETDMFEDTEDKRRSNFLKAETCTDYLFFQDKEVSKCRG